MPAQSHISDAVKAQLPALLEYAKRSMRKTAKRRNLTITIPIQKVQPEQGLASGWASIVTDANGVPIVDFDGDVIRVEDLEKAAQDAFMKQSGAGRGGDMHEPDGVGKASIVESMVITKAKREAFGFGPGPEGWLVTLKIHDPELRRQIREGEKLELSMAGTAEAVDLEAA